MHLRQLGSSCLPRDVFESENVVRVTSKDESVWSCSKGKVPAKAAPEQVPGQVVDGRLEKLAGS